MGMTPPITAVHLAKSTDSPASRAAWSTPDEGDEVEVGAQDDLGLGSHLFACDLAEAGAHRRRIATVLVLAWASARGTAH